MKRYREMKTTLFLALYILVILPQGLLSQWVRKSNGISTNQSINTLVSNSGYIFAGSNSEGVLRSQDNGDSWIAVNNGLTNKNVSSLLVKNDYLFAGTLGGGIFVSTNYGTNWSTVNNGLTNLYVVYLHIKDSILYAGTSTAQNSSGGVFYSSNFGISWIFCGLNFLSIKSISSSGIYVIAGTTYNGTTGGVYRTTNLGSNWSEINIGLGGVSRNANAMATDGANVYLGAGDGVYRSVYFGNNWQTINNNLSPTSVNCLSLINFNIFIGTQNGIFVTTSYGAVWNTKNQGFSTIPPVLSVMAFNNFVFAGTSGQSVWRRSYNELIGVQKITNTVPVNCYLNQNYPNPFNSYTVIKFTVPKNNTNKNTNVKLIVYDASGKLVVALIDENLDAGEYLVKFSGQNLASGIYYYKLLSEDFSQTRKMILIK